MFGILYTLFITSGLMINEIKESFSNKEYKRKYKNKDNLTYTDANGHSRLVLNDNLVFHTHNTNGDYILEDLSGKTLKNFTDEKEKQILIKRKRNAIDNKETTYCFDNNNHKHNWICKGKRFKDIETGDIYVIRFLEHKYYYMDVNTGFLIRKTDWQINNDNKYKYNNKYAELYKDIDIDKFNNIQRKIEKDNRILFRNFDYDISCDYYK